MRSNFNGWDRVTELPLDSVMNMILINHTVASANSDDWISSYIETYGSPTVLDFGCGIGRNSFALADRTPKMNVIAYDNPAMIQHAEKYCQLKFKKSINEFSNLTLTSDWNFVKSLKIDYTIAILVFQHIKELELIEYLKDIKKISKKLIISGRRFNDDIMANGKHKNTWEIVEGAGLYPVDCNRIDNKSYNAYDGGPDEHFVCMYDLVTDGKKAIFDQYPCRGIFDQQPNKCTIVNLGYTDSRFYFNSCIFNHKNEPHLMSRESIHITGNKFCNTLKLFRLNNDSSLKTEIPLKIQDEVTNEQYEDPRVMFYNNKYYVSCANYQYDNVKYIHQKLLVFDTDFNHIGNIHPIYDGNSGCTNENTKHQKNWTWFIYNNRLMCVYRMNPHTVVEFDFNGKALAEYKSFVNINELWHHGECRMGTNPILVGGVYHNFFHSSVPWKNSKRKYLMGRYVFEAIPPFRVLAISKDPILYGNEKDLRILPLVSPLVIFPCGAIFDNNEFKVSFGLNDEKTGIIKL